MTRSVLVWWVGLQTEHFTCDFSPTIELSRISEISCRKKYSRVNIRLILSGLVLLNIYEYFRLIDQTNKFESIVSPQEIFDKDFSKSFKVCEKALNFFVSIMVLLAEMWHCIIYRIEAFILVEVLLRKYCQC